MTKLQFISFCIIAFVFVTFFMPVCFAVDVVEATEAINQAESNLVFAFLAVADAYNAGAEVAGLLEKLDFAGSLLSEAQIAVKSGNYETAISLAMKCSNAVGDTAAEAQLLIINADKEKTDIMTYTMVGSSVGLVLLVVLSVIGWKYLKSRYYEQVLEMKPEVEESY